MQKSDSAVYLPALSEAYVAYQPGSSFSRSIPVVPDDLNFLDPGKGLFHYPFALTSAGQTKGKISVTPNMLTTRDRDNTVVLADSGGFQIQGGKMLFGPLTSETMLRWMEHMGDHSMILDFPTGGIAAKTVKAHHERLIQSHQPQLNALMQQNGLSWEFNTCLLQTLINNDDFLALRKPHETRLLNVVQGRSEAESKAWYEAVKHYPFEDWAFAGKHQSSFSMILSRIFDMLDDGKLDQVEWIHVLGTSKPFAGAILTVLQQCLRERLGTSIQISFDSASPFRNAAFNGIYLGAWLDRDGWSFVAGRLPKIDPAHRELKLNEYVFEAFQYPNQLTALRRKDGFRNAVPGMTAIGDRVTPNDILQNVKGGADPVGVVLLMNHNTQVMIDTFRAINDILADPAPVSEFIPNTIWSVISLVRQAFHKASKDVHQFIADTKTELDRFAHL